MLPLPHPLFAGSHYAASALGGTPPTGFGGLGRPPPRVAGFAGRVEMRWQPHALLALAAALYAQLYEWNARAHAFPANVFHDEELTFGRWTEEMLA